MADLLLELGLEEIPDRFLPALREGLKTQVLAALGTAGLKVDPAAALAYGGPRRLAVIVKGLPARLPDEMKKGPPVQQAFTADGKPTPAAEGFAKKLGLTVADLKKSEDGKFLFGLQKGGATIELLPAALANAVQKLDLPKAMRWGAGEHEFIRPLRWIVALLDESGVPLSLFGIASGNHSQGPRQPGGNPVLIARPSDYLAALEKAGVYADFGARKKTIHAQLLAAAQKAGGRLQEDEELLDRVADLVETPGVICGNFDPSFLQIPAAILVTAMREHQKNFSVTDKHDKLLPVFLAVIDKPGDPQGFILRGNQAVLKSRLDDAKFFYEEDLRTGLDALREKTKEINFYAGLGSLYDKSERLRALGGWLCAQLGIESGTRPALDYAAKFAKADLASNLIGEKEFVTLQGLAGSFFAAHALLKNANELDSFSQAHTAEAIAGQYGTQKTRGTAGNLLALSDRLDTLTGFFMIGKTPTGSKDPFALRRAGNHFWQHYFHVPSALPDVSAMIGAAAEAYRNSGIAPPADNAWMAMLEKFLGERLENYFSEQQFSKTEFRSVAGDPLHDWALKKQGPQRLLWILEALRRSRASADFAAVCEAAIRITNILKGQPAGESYLAERFTESAERDLDAIFKTVEPKISKLKAWPTTQENYGACFAELAKLRAPLDHYFSRESNVMVMTDDGPLRTNRLAFLRAVQGLFDQLFDPAILAGEARR